MGGNATTGTAGNVAIFAGDSYALDGASSFVTGGASLTGIGGGFYGLGGNGPILGGMAVIDAGLGAFNEPFSGGDISIGEAVASAVTVGRSDNMTITAINGLTHARALAVGAGGAAMVKHLSAVSPNVDPHALYPSAMYTLDLYVPGATPGDVVTATFERGVGPCQVYGTVIAADEVRVNVLNPGTNTRMYDLDPGAFHVTLVSYQPGPTEAAHGYVETPPW